MPEGEASTSADSGGMIPGIAGILTGCKRVAKLLELLLEVALSDFIRP